MQRTIRLSREQFIRAISINEIIDRSEDDYEAEDFTREVAYRGVGAIYRSIQLRASAVSTMPFALFRNGRRLKKENPIYRSMQELLEPALFEVEGDLCVSGAAYWRIERNQVGLNTTMRRYLPKTIGPVYDSMGNVASFVRRNKGREIEIPAEEMIWWWMPSFEYENAPGPGPLQVALSAAGVQYHLGKHSDLFFKRGAIKEVMFVLEGQGVAGMPAAVSPAEAERVESEWRRRVRGIRSAWNALVMRSALRPFFFGTDPKDLAAPELIDISLQQISQAFGVPLSILNSTASTYASASADAFHFYDKLVVPRYRMLLPGINRFLDYYGMRAEAEPHLLDAYQEKQLAQAQAVEPLLGKIYTIDNGREIAGMPPPTPEERAELGYATNEGGTDQGVSAETRALQTLWAEIHTALGQPHKEGQRDVWRAY